MNGPYATTISNSIFQNCSGPVGAAITLESVSTLAMDAATTLESGPTLAMDACTFVGNTVTDPGGSIVQMLDATGSLAVANSVFTNNLYPADGADIAYGQAPYSPFSCTNTCAVTLVADQCPCGIPWPVSFKPIPRKATLKARAGTVRRFKLKVTNNGTVPITVADGAELLLTADDGLTLRKSHIFPTIKNAHNKTTHVTASEWTWPVVLEAKKTRTYKVEVAIDACTEATALTVATAVGLTVGPTFTINVKPALPKVKATCA